MKKKNIIISPDTCTPIAAYGYFVVSSGDSENYDTQDLNRVKKSTLKKWDKIQNDYFKLQEKLKARYALSIEPRAESTEAVVENAD